MKTLKFKNGDEMPALGLGTWKSDPADVYAAVQTAVAEGYRHIDCAAIYGNESTIGQALEDLFQRGVVRRDELWITSKLWCNRHGSTNVQGALQKTLDDLRLQYLDLYLIHWPITLKYDAVYPSGGDDFLPPGEIPLTDTWAGMEYVCGLGLCKHIGVSNFTTGKLKMLQDAGKIAPELNQLEMHPLLAQKEMLAYCMANNIHLTAYSPLGSRDRDLAFKADNEPDMLKHPTIVAVAEKHGASPAQILIAWHINRGCSVIPKSVNPGRIAENFAAAAIELSREDMDQIASINREFRFLDGSIWTANGSPYTMEYLWKE